MAKARYASLHCVIFDAHRREGQPKRQITCGIESGATLLMTHACPLQPLTREHAGRFCSLVISLTKTGEVPTLPPMIQITVQLPAELDAFVESSVASGDYAGPNEIVTQALYAYRDRVELDRIKLQRLPRHIQTGIEQLERGEFVTEFDVEQFLAQRRTKHPRTAAAA